MGIRIAMTAVIPAPLVVLAAACGGGQASIAGPRLVLDGDSFDIMPAVTPWVKKRLMTAQPDTPERTGPMRAGERAVVGEAIIHDR